MNLIVLLSIATICYFDNELSSIRNVRNKNVTAILALLFLLKVFNRSTHYTSILVHVSYLIVFCGRLYI